MNVQEFMRVVTDFCQECDTCSGYNLNRCHAIPLLLETENRLCDSWKGFLQFAPKDVACIRARLQELTCARLLTCSARLASYSIRQNNPVYLWYSLLGIAIDPDIIDYRNVLGVLCLVHDACSRLGSVPESYWRDASAAATSKRADLMDGYRQEGVKNLRSMGWEALGTGAAFLYVPIGWKNSEPDWKKLGDPFKPRLG